MSVTCAASTVTCQPAAVPLRSLTTKEPSADLVVCCLPLRVTGAKFAASGFVFVRVPGVVVGVRTEVSVAVGVWLGTTVAT